MLGLGNSLINGGGPSGPFLLAQYTSKHQSGFEPDGWTDNVTGTGPFGGDPVQYMNNALNMLIAILDDQSSETIFTRGFGSYGASGNKAYSGTIKAGDYMEITYEISAGVDAARWNNNPITHKTFGLGQEVTHSGITPGDSSTAITITQTMTAASDGASMNFGFKVGTAKASASVIYADWFVQLWRP